MTTRSAGGRPWVARKRATSSATAVRISSAIGPPSRRRAVPGSVTRQPPAGGGSGGRASPRPTASRASSASRATSWSSVDHALGHLAFERRVPDRRQVHEDVGRGAVGGRLGEMRGHVQVARGIDIAATGERLGDTGHLQARLEAGHRDLGGLARCRLDRSRPGGPFGIGLARQLHRDGEHRRRQRHRRRRASAGGPPGRTLRPSPTRGAPRARRTWAGPRRATRPWPRAHRPGRRPRPMRCRRPGRARPRRGAPRRRRGSGRGTGRGPGVAPPDCRFGEVRRRATPRTASRRTHRDGPCETPRSEAFGVGDGASAVPAHPPRTDIADPRGRDPGPAGMDAVRRRSGPRRGR